MAQPPSAAALGCVRPKVDRIFNLSLFGRSEWIGDCPRAGRVKGNLQVTHQPPRTSRRDSSTRPAHTPAITHRSARFARLDPPAPRTIRPRRTAGVRASSSMSVDHVPWSSEMPSGRGWRPGSRRGQPRCPRRPSAGPASLRWDMNYPPTNKMAVLHTYSRRRALDDDSESVCSCSGSLPGEGCLPAAGPLEPVRTVH